jgi:hypothetical protein
MVFYCIYFIQTQKTNAHNNFFFDITHGQTFKFLMQDILTNTFPTHFKLSQLPNETSGLHIELLLKKNILIEVFGGNYSTLDGLVNGANGMFQDYIKVFNKQLIWIDFENLPIGLNTRLQYTYMYDQIQNLQKSWTPI